MPLLVGYFACIQEPRTPPPHHSPDHLQQTHPEILLVTIFFQQHLRKPDHPLLPQAPLPKPRLPTLKRIASRGFVRFRITLPKWSLWGRGKNISSLSVSASSQHIVMRHLMSPVKGDGVSEELRRQTSDWKWNHVCNKSALPHLHSRNYLVRNKKDRFC